ncbi:MAG: 30S ribosome-binding factor RbfA [Rhodobacteraceae bacterium]|nr:30S ribosome-binding factor RbfA [Paracoccaceae bacterium]
MGRRKSTRGQPTQRQLRVGELVRRGLAELLTDWTFVTETLTSVSVTVGEVRMSSDLKHATIYVLPLGGENTDGVIEQLNAEHREFYRELRKKLHLKYAPRLTFVADRVFDQIDETRRLLNLTEVKRDLEQPSR